jgi:hypothetical protein
MRNSTSDTYWLADTPEVVISQLNQFDTQWRTYQGNPFYDMWFRNSYAYYSTVLDEDSVIAAINFRGEKGELVEMKVPQARSLIRQMHTLITKQRLAFQVIAEINSYNFIQNMRKANAIIQAELKNGGMDKKRDLVTEHSLVLGSGFYACLQRFDKGKKIGTSKYGGPIYEGEAEIMAVHPVDIIYDFRMPFENCDWVLIKTKRNRYNLAAMHPELKDKILGLPSCWETSAQVDQFFAADDRDAVYVYHLIHDLTPALDQGRYLCYADDQTIFYDDINIYGGIPVEPIIAEPIFTYGVGYPVFSNLLASQEMYDHDFSAVATNHSALAIRNLAIARNSNVSIKAMPGGLNLVSYTPQNVPGGGKPEVLDFNTPNNDVYNFQDRLLNNMQLMTNINSAIRGEISAGQSGTSIATLSANAIEFMTSYSKVVQFATENILYWKMKILERTVKSPRKLSVAMDSGISYSDSYTGDDLKGVQGIKLISVNPMMQTQAGRETVADKLLQTGTVKSTQEYIAVLDGAPADRMYGKELSESDFILYEKEQMLRGEKPEALATDNHPKHIHCHTNDVLNNPSARNDPNIRAVTEAHILEHLRLSRETDPSLMAMATTGVMPEMAPPPPPMADGGMPPMGPEIADSAAGPADDLLGREGGPV